MFVAHARRNEDTFQEMKIQLTSRIGESGKANGKAISRFLRIPPIIGR